MLLLKIYNDSLLSFAKILDIFFIYNTYCKKYNIKFIFIDDYIIKFLNHKIIDSNFNNFITYDIKKLLQNKHTNFINLNNLNDNILININIQNNSFIYELLLNYITDAEINNNIMSYKNIIYNNLFIYFNYNYICIDLHLGDIINDTKNYVSIDTFKKAYDNINKLNYKTIIIKYNNEINFDKYFNNCIIINYNDYNGIELFYIMLNSNNLISSNNLLSKYVLLYK